MSARQQTLEQPEPLWQPRQDEDHNWKGVSSPRQGPGKGEKTGVALAQLDSRGTIS